jgi:hypothetical protein
LKNVVCGLLLVAAFVLTPSAAGATIIEYQATNLTGDIWQYDYFVADGLFNAQQGFVVFFDESLYADLLPVTPSPPDWDVLSTNPDIVLQSDGTYDALALVDNPLFAGPFSVSFTWLGLAGSTPGSQIFDVYNLDASGFPESIESGVTSLPDTPTPIPEPSTLLLVSAGVVGGWQLRRQRRATGSI